MSQSTPSSSPSTERTNYLSSDDEDGNSDEEVDKEDMDPTYLAGLDENGCACESSTSVDQQIINTQAVDLTNEDWSVEAVIPLDTHETRL